MVIKCKSDHSNKTNEMHRKLKYNIYDVESYKSDDIATGGLRARKLNERSLEIAVTK